jgi:ribosome maturation factor RimP
MIENVKKKVLKLASEVADELGIEVVDVEVFGKGKLLLRVVIDKEGGITLGDCESFSRSFEAILDVEDPVPGSYTLEVSSPGLDRPLKEIRDFEKSTGKLARLVTTEKIENQNFFIGRIIEVSKGLIRILVHEREITIPFEKIAKARLEVELK